MDKIKTFRKNLDQANTHYTAPNAPVGNTQLPSLSPYTESEIAKFISNSTNAYCDLDPILTTLLKHCLPSLIPTITSIVNLSLETGQFPDLLKQALVKPLIKKPGVSPEEFKNYRPVSNIPFISKIIEKASVKRLDDYMSKNHFHEKFQSAYRKEHSTETALVRIHDDILRALDNKRGILLVMLDLSAAFDIIDHRILLDRLRERLGFEGTALNWFKEYHTNRTQVVVIQGSRSKPATLLFGAPEGSIIGPEIIRYILFQLPTFCENMPSIFIPMQTTHKSMPLLASIVPMILMWQLQR